MEDPNNTLTNVVNGNEDLPQHIRSSGNVALLGDLNSREI